MLAATYTHKKSMESNNLPINPILPNHLGTPLGGSVARPPFHEISGITAVTPRVAYDPSTDIIASSSSRNAATKAVHENTLRRSSSHTHSKAIVVIDGDTDEEEGGLRLIKSAGNRRIRPIPCPWHDEIEPGQTAACDAVLGSYHLFKKHLRIHQERALTGAKRDGILYHVKCGWKACPSPIVAVNQIQEHCDRVHLAGIRETYCPFKDCEAPSISRTEYNTSRHFQGQGHPSTSNPNDVLRPDPERLRLNPRPKTPTPINLDLEWHLNPFLSTVLPYRGLRAKQRGRSDSPPKGPKPAPLASVRHLILPERGAEYFEPFCNDAPSGCHSTSLSYSIFKHPYFKSEVVDDIVEIKGRLYNLATILRGGSLRDALRVVNAQSTSGGIVISRIPASHENPEVRPASSSSSPLDTLAPPDACPATENGLIPHPRPKRTWAQVRLDARAYIDHSRDLVSAKKRKREQGIEERAKRAREDVPVVIGESGIASNTVSTAQKTVAPAPLDRRMIMRAAKRYATKLAGRSYGARHEKELYMYLKRGSELGEMV